MNNNGNKKASSGVVVALIMCVVVFISGFGVYNLVGKKAMIDSGMQITSPKQVIDGEEIDEKNAFTEGRFSGYYGKEFAYIKEISPYSNGLSNNEPETLFVPNQINGKDVRILDGAFYKYCHVRGLLKDVVFENDNKYYITENNTVFSKDKKNLIYCYGLVSEYTVPAEVKTICGFAFSEMHFLRSVVIPEGVEEICNCAFNDCRLTEVEIPDSVKKIGKSAFSGNMISKLKLSSNMEEIGDRAFASLKCKEINLPETLKTLGSYVFDDSDLQKVTIPSSLKTAGNQILTNCKYVEELNINCPLKAFGEYDFFSYYTDSNVSSYGKKLVINTAEPLYPFKYISTMMAFDKVIINEPCSSSDFNMENGTSDMEQRGFQNIYYEIKDNTISFEYVADVSYKNGKSSLVELNFKK